MASRTTFGDIAPDPANRGPRMTSRKTPQPIPLATWPVVLVTGLAAFLLALGAVLWSEAGAVTVDGVVARTAGQAVTEAADIVAEPGFVGRGALNLAAALDRFGHDPRGADALDVGASTGGFTEVLLARGARRVIALDVGRGQLHATLAADPRVTSLEGVNARHLAAGDLPFAPDLVVVDVSFISLTLVLPPVLALAAPAARLVTLVKPQFEVGRAHIGKGGIVRPGAPVEAAVGRVVAAVAAAGFRPLGTIASPIRGGDGNEEVLLAAVRP
jgi:23S rRNA (cytidine1920-2'-O)/16S rRNA (cytidine1409-2'-O)-methyltransferase